ncbi:MAG: hypothetical protein QOG15_747 [Solirubrobacteraceae bacterium]|nr:hypothetical protein [Solirubrobacteraceae bacterium]
MGARSPRVVAHRPEHLPKRAAIIGSGLVAGELVRNLRRHSGLGLMPVGIVENAEHPRSVEASPELTRWRSSS